MDHLADWLAKIASQHPREIDLGLERISQVATRMQVTEFVCPVITIAGTNGKGSCVKFLESILTAQGYRVGAYSSPHLLKFNERIRIANKDITDQALIQAFTQVEQAAQGSSLTFFEFTTLAALWLFQQAELQVLILEVGLGGRLDAVNLVDADIAIITSIDLDHTDWLGTTREKIASEKAGIFRPNQIAIVGDPRPPQSLLNVGNELGLHLLRIHQDFDYDVCEQQWQWQRNSETLLDLPLPNLPIQNAATALMAIKALDQHMTVTPQAIKIGLAQAQLMGRFQRVSFKVPCILDVAHNPASARLLAQKMRSLTPPAKVLGVVAMLNDKDILNTLGPLKGLVDQWFVANLHVPRGATAQQLASSLRDIDNDSCYTYDYVIDAFQAAASHATHQNIILVFGSFYTVAEVLHYFNTCEELA